MSKQPTFEDAIADLNSGNITMWNAQEHFPKLLAGLNDLARRVEALEKKSNANPT